MIDRWQPLQHLYLQSPPSFHHFPSLHFSFRLFHQIAYVIAKEILRPIADVTIFINLKSFNFGGAVVNLAKIECCVLRRDMFLSNASLQAI